MPLLLSRFIQLNHVKITDGTTTDKSSLLDHKRETYHDINEVQNGTRRRKNWEEAQPEATNRKVFFGEVCHGCQRGNLVMYLFIDNL